MTNKKVPNFRKLIAQENITFLAGRNDVSNDELVEQALPNEFLLHTASTGSPFVNIKGKPKIGEIQRAAVFCAAYSREYKKNPGRKIIEIHLFKKSDTKKPFGAKPGLWVVKKAKTIKVKNSEIKKFLEEKK